MNRRKNIALFMAILENEFSHSVLEGAVLAAEECDANLIVFPMEIMNATYADMEITVYRYQYNALSEYMKANQIDGIAIEYGTIVSTLSMEEKREFLKLADGKPTVLLSEAAEGYESILVDNETGFVDLINHMIVEHGYKKIGYLSGTRGNADADKRLNVFRKTLTANGLPYDEDWIVYGNFSEYVEPEVTDFINRHPDVEVIICANDSMAVGAANAMRKMGLEPGKDIKLTGFDDLIFGLFMNPSLSTVKADASELGYNAVKKLCSQMSEGSNLINSKMVIRDSCGCCGFELDEAWKNKLGISEDWRTTGRKRAETERYRRILERELGNVAREIIFSEKTEKEKYIGIINTLKRLAFNSGHIYLYDSIVPHEKDTKWQMPKTINLVAQYSLDGEYETQIFNIGEKSLNTYDIFAENWLSNGSRREVVVFPLFFGANQIGLIVVETDHDRFIHAYDIAGQISSTLYIILMNEQHKQLQLELEKASKSKSQFLANMSHEIRTPINAILGFDEMILRESKEPEVLEYANDIHSATNVLLRLVNDVLDFSKIEAGKMELINEEFSLNKLLQNVINMMQDKATQKKLVLELDKDDRLPTCLYGDSGRLQQILINLISNAVKYTEKGCVSLSVNLVEAQEDVAKIRFAVKDTGIGIREADIERLFNEFDRIDEKRNRSIEGTGLGINIVDKLLKLMGSKLEVSSVYMEGSEFSFLLELEIIEDNISDDNESEGVGISVHTDDAFEAPDIKILVVDDNDLNRKVICSLLKKTKMTIHQAAGGRECIDLVKKNRYDLILLDHMMPEVDGIEALHEMLNNKLIDINETPVIALTANAISGAKEMYLEAGFSGYLSKPVMPNKLNETLFRYIKASKFI
ncbi:MAG: response regulator [Lachnospiraceae bacterium]|nr:response regulator [Lachnospiraceae bacterium]